jgi:hypothetical protein
MAISTVSNLTQNMSQTIADLQPGDMLLICFENSVGAAPGMPAAILDIGETFTAVTPPALSLMDHPFDSDTHYPSHWQPWFIQEYQTMASYDTGDIYMCAWILTDFTGGSHNISITYPNSTLVWGKVIRGVDTVVWGHDHVRAVEINLGSNGQIAYTDFPHTVAIDSDNAIVLHVFASQDEYNPTIADDQPADYGTKVYQLEGDPDASPVLFYLRTIEPAATSFTMSQPNMILGDTRFFGSPVHVWYVIFYGGAEVPPEEEDPPVDPPVDPPAPGTPLGQITGEVQDVREWITHSTPTVEPTFSSAKARTGAYSVRFSQMCKAAGIAFVPQSSFRAGAWINHLGPDTSAPYYRANIFTIVTANHTILVTWKVAGDAIAIAIDNIAVAIIPVVSANRLSATNQWMHIGVTYKAGVGGKIRFWVNGTSVLSYASEALENALGLFVGGNNPLDASEDPMAISENIGGGYIGWANYAHFDDVYVDGNVDVDQEPPPDRFLFSRTFAAGPMAQWTPIGQTLNHQCVDDEAPNDDGDYVRAITAGPLDLYKTAVITLPADHIIGDVRPIALAKRLEPGPTMKFVAADATHPNLESAAKSPNTSYDYVWVAMPLAPDGEAWTADKFNNPDSTIGIKSAGTFA